MSTPTEITVAKLEQKFDNLEASFSELRSDVKDISDKLDKLVIEWQKFGGLYNSVETLQRQINTHETWINKYTSALEGLTDAKKNWTLTIWRIFQVITTTTILYLIGFKK